ncbi:MAG: Holliday junction resolvase RuvX [Bacteroidota bacterium]|nr:Holliday junction resolvase RuvX [Bacteroidota bacterium]MDP4207088.1 Holliday junction resolvase RuvX [Bacteroidota bacterium]
MGRILAIDYGKKRIGIAVTDPLKIIGNKLTTVTVSEIWKFLDQYFKSEPVERVIIGYPLQLNNEPSESVRYIEPFIRGFKNRYPEIPIETADERFTSKLAHQTMLEAGVRKKDRQNKEVIDALSATIMLQTYLESLKFKI